MPRLLFISICAAILLSACSRTPEGEPVAVVAGKTIGAEEYRTRYVDFLLTTGLPDEAGRRAAYLERLVTMKLMAHDALEGGLAGESAYLFAEERTRRKLLIDAYVHRAVYDTLAVSEQDLQNMFVRVNTTVTARHLYAPTREAADTLYERLRRGASFEELAEEVFVDTALARHGGRLGSFGFDEMDPAFEEVAFTIAPGAVSRPVRTAQGYSIVQVEDRFTKPILTETEFAAQKNKMEWYVLDRKRRRARTALSMRLREEACPVVPRSGIRTPTGAGHWRSGETGRCAIDHPRRCAIHHPGRCAIDHPRRCAIAHPKRCAIAHPKRCAIAHPKRCAIDHPGRCAIGHAGRGGARLAGRPACDVRAAAGPPDLDRLRFQGSGPVYRPAAARPRPYRRGTPALHRRADRTGSIA